MKKKEELWRENKMKKNIIVVLIMIVSAIMSGCSTEEGSAGAKAYNWAKETVFGDDKTSTESAAEVSESATEIASEDKPVESVGIDDKFLVYHKGDTIKMIDSKTTWSVHIDDVYTTTETIGQEAAIRVIMTVQNTGSKESYIDSGTVYGDDFELPSTYMLPEKDDNITISASLPPGRKAKIHALVKGQPEQFEKIELQLASNVVVDLKPALVVESKQQDTTTTSESNEFSSDPDTYVDDDPLMYSSAGYEIYYPNADDGYVNIRSGPGTEYPVISTMENGENQFDRSNRMYEDDKWIEVEVYGEDGILHGYVAKSQVKKYEP